MQKNKFSLLILSLLVIMTSCEKDDDNASGGGSPTIETRVIVTCEGSFQGNNASLTSYDKTSQELVNGAFESINGYSPGDVLQSMTEVNGKIYLVLNNSSRVEVLDAESMVAESPINGFISPRYLQSINGDKAYVTNIFSNEIQVVDLDSKTVTGAIDCSGWTEGMLMVDDMVYVSKSNGDKIMVIDTSIDQVVDSIAVTPGPVNLVLDDEGMMWVVCNGNFGAVAPKVHRIDPSTNSVVKDVAIPMPWAYQMAIRVNGDRDQLYLLNNDVYTMLIGDDELDSTPLIDDGVSYYGLGVDPENGDIYVGDAGSFVSDGTVRRYDLTGTPIDEFLVGISPNGFYFGIE